MRDNVQVEIGVIQGPTVRAEEIFVTPPGTPPSESEDSPQPDHGVAASEKEKKLKSPEPSKATGTKRKYTRLGISSNRCWSLRSASRNTNMGRCASAGGGLPPYTCGDNHHDFN